MRFSCYKKKLIPWKAEAEILEINELAKVPTSSNNLKAEVDNLDLVKLKAVPKDLKKNTKQKNK